MIDDGCDIDALEPYLSVSDQLLCPYCNVILNGNLSYVLYFVFVFGTLCMINLFVVVILGAYVDNAQFEKQRNKLVLLQLNEWTAIWKKIYD